MKKNGQENGKEKNASFWDNFLKKKKLFGIECWVKMKEREELMGNSWISNERGCNSRSPNTEGNARSTKKVRGLWLAATQATQPKEMMSSVGTALHL